MPRRRDDLCRGCGDHLEFDMDNPNRHHCDTCSTPATKKALNRVYGQMNETDVVRVVKSVPLRICKVPPCDRWAERNGFCKDHQEDA